jgi:anti-sigma B factor antagonist
MMAREWFLRLQAMHNDAPLKIDRREGKAPGTHIFVLSGPVTLANIFALQDVLRGGELPSTSILDLTEVPYMDSAGMGAVINYYTHCERRGARVIVVGVSHRVSELFKLTRVDAVIPMAATAAEAEA